MVPKGWSNTNVGDALERVSTPVSVDDATEYHQIGIRSHGKGLFDKEPVTGAELGGKRVFWIEPDCFVVNIVFAWEQAVGKTTADDVGKIASHRFPMYRPRQGRCDIDFIEYLFKTPLGKHLLGLASPGGAGRNKTLGQKEFDRVPLVLPPLSEQRKIAEILSTWDRAIEANEALLANARTQKRALMQSLLTGKRRFPEFEGQEWREVRLGDIIVSMDAGTSVNSTDVPADDNRLGVLKTSSVSDGYFRPERSKAVDDETEISRLREPVSGNTIIMSRMNTPALVGANGFVANSTPSLFLPDRLWAIKPRASEVVPRWLGHLLASAPVRFRLSRLATGTSGSMKNITKGDVRSLPVVLPGIEEQQAIARALTTAEDEATSLSLVIGHMRSEKKALMQQLLTGKRRVAVDA